MLIWEIILPKSGFEMHNFQAIIFDLDGVIINSEILWDQCSTELLAQYGHSYQRSFTKHLCTGKSFVEGTAIIKQYYRIETDLSRLVDQRKAIIRRLYAEKLAFIKGFPEFINYLQRNRTALAVATSCDQELLRIADERLGLSKIFKQHIYTLDHVNQLSKPNPEIFLYTARQLLVQPEAAVVIEDSPNGVQAAKNAGMYCIGLVGTYDKEKLRQADALADSYQEIVQLLFTGQQDM